MPFGSACTTSTRHLGRPLSRAISTSSLSSASIIAARIIRNVYGTITMTSVATGSTSSVGSDHGATPGGNTETAGNKCQITAAKKITRAIATTNSGRAVTASAVTDRT